MGFESQGGDSWYGRSPGGFEFGVQGWVYGPPVPKSITFFLDGTAMVCDQYGRQIRRAVLDDGSELRFADTPPDANRDGIITARPHLATHIQVVAALAAERIDWMSYEVRYRDRGGNKVRGGLKMAEAIKLQAKLLADGIAQVAIDHAIACAGWPQLPYDELKKLPELPPTPEAELRKILDPKLRRDALRIRSEVNAEREKELVAAAE